MPACAPDLNPADGIWALLEQAMVNFAAVDLDGLACIVKRKLKKIQYWPHLIDRCLAGTGLTIEPWRPLALRVQAGENIVSLITRNLLATVICCRGRQFDRQNVASSNI